MKTRYWVFILFLFVVMAFFIVYMHRRILKLPSQNHDINEDHLNKIKHKIYVGSKVLKSKNESLFPETKVTHMKNKSNVVEKFKPEISKIKTKAKAKNVSINPMNYYPLLLNQSFICKPLIKKAYSSIQNSEIEESKNWCTANRRIHSVKIGVSWGSLRGKDRLKWEEYNCNEILRNNGNILSCNERLGWPMLKDWSENKVGEKKGVPTLKNPRAKTKKNVIVQGVSHLSCVQNLETSKFCTFENVLVDFSKARIVGSSRSFHNGFIQTFGELSNPAEYPKYPGLIHVDAKPNLKTNKQKMDFIARHCDIVENRTTFVLSNDDIFNLGHYMNDVIGVWAMTILSKIYSRELNDSILLNIDGFRRSGPAGGIHRLMLANNPDFHGPFSLYYESWFSELTKAIEFQKKKVCFSRIYFPVYPGVAWFWKNWSQVDKCSLLGPSPLFQSFNLFLRSSWLKKFGLDSLPDPPKDEFHIIIGERKINPKKRSSSSSSRYILNLAQLKQAISSIQGVKVSVINFADYSFPEQVKISHSASIMIAMHGAGVPHMFHMAIGRPKCCGQIEIFPDRSVEFHSIHGHGNHARHLGIYYHRVVSPDGTTHARGTAVPVSEIKNRVLQIISDIDSKGPTCLHDPRDTSTTPKVFSY